MKIQKKKTVEYRVVIPKELVLVILQYHHSTPMSGHHGIHRTLAIIQRKYWWLTLLVPRADLIGLLESALSATGLRY